MMMIIGSLSIFATTLLLTTKVRAACNEDSHHPENGGYFVEGIAGISAEIDPNSSNNRRYDNATWARGM